MFKNFYLLICVVIMGCGVALPSNATSGRTNKDGCHNSKKVGYHCHGSPSRSLSPAPSSTTRLNSEQPSNTSVSPSVLNKERIDKQPIKIVEDVEFDECVLALRQRSTYTPSQLISNNKLEYSAHFFEEDGTTEKVTCFIVGTQTTEIKQHNN